MAKISENFLEFKGTPSFNRIPITCTHDQWYVTIGKNSVSKVKDSKSIHTWTLLQGHIHYFTTPVSYFEGKLYSVMDDNVLLKWSEEDINLEKSEKVEFQEEVHSVIHLQEAEPFVVFQSGKFVIVDSNEFCHLKPLESIQLKQDDYLEWVDAAVSATNIGVFYLTYNKKNNQKTVYHFSVRKEDKSVSLHDTFCISHENSFLKVCSLNHQDSTFFTLWSDGSLKCYNMKDSSNKVMLSLEDISRDTITDICCIDSKHIIIVKGKPKNEECVLEIWDTEHLILRGSKKIKASELVSLQVSATNDYIFLNYVCDKLIAIPYFLDSSFASTLHTSEPKEFQQLAWNTDLDIEIIKEVSPEDDDEPMIIDVVLGPSSFSSVEELVEKLQNEDSFCLKFILESQIIKILQFVIRHKRENENDLNKDMYNLLNIVFSSSFNDLLLMKCLKVLDLMDVVVTLRLLSQYMNPSINIPADKVQKPTVFQIVNWLRLVLNSHIGAFMLSKDKVPKKVFEELQEKITFMLQEYEDLKSVQSYLSLCCGKKDILPQQHSVEKYCMETLDV